MKQKRLVCAVGAAIIALSEGALGQATVDLDTFTNGFRVDGWKFGTFLGLSVSGAGDVNGDGFADVIAATNYHTQRFGGQSPVYVVFGKDDSTTLDSNALGDRGTELGCCFNTAYGVSVSGLGDINGDGFADVATGIYYDGYVTFGRSDLHNVTFPFMDDGFGISGDNLVLGTTISGTGDINGDGLDDLVVGHDGPEDFVVFGKADSEDIDTDDLGTGGYGILGGDTAYAVSGAGDVNGDGRADIITISGGDAYVIFGKQTTSDIQLQELGSGGFRIAGGSSGRSVSGAGDVNGDGLSDLIVRTLNEQSCVVFGKWTFTTIDLGFLKGGGFCMSGAGQVDLSPASVSGAGDVNGDGYSDLIVGVTNEEMRDASYVVYGGSASDDIDLDTLGSRGYRIDGAGFSVSGAGDVNGDGLADLVLGAPETNHPLGAVYVVFSEAAPPLSATYRAFTRTGDSPRMPVGVTGDASNQSTPDSRVWVDFADGTVPLFSRPPYVDVTLTRSAREFANAGADVSWSIQSNRIQWSSAELTFRYLDSELQISDESRLHVFTARTPDGPYRPVPTSVHSENNTILATIDELGYFFLGNESIFDYGFEE